MFQFVIEKIKCRLMQSSNRLITTHYKLKSPAALNLCLFGLISETTPRILYGPHQ